MHAALQAPARIRRLPGPAPAAGAAPQGHRGMGLAAPPGTGRVEPAGPRGALAPSALRRRQQHQRLLPLPVGLPRAGSPRQGGRPVPGGAGALPAPLARGDRSQDGGLLPGAGDGPDPGAVRTRRALPAAGHAPAGPRGQGTQPRADAPLPLPLPDRTGHRLNHTPCTGLRRALPPRLRSTQAQRAYKTRAPGHPHWAALRQPQPVGGGGRQGRAAGYGNGRIAGA